MKAVAVITRIPEEHTIQAVTVKIFFPTLAITFKFTEQLALISGYGKGEDKSPENCSYVCEDLCVEGLEERERAMSRG